MNSSSRCSSQRTEWYICLYFNYCSRLRTFPHLVLLTAFVTFRHSVPRLVFPLQMLKNPTSLYLQQLSPAPLQLVFRCVFLGGWAWYRKFFSANMLCIGVGDFLWLVFHVHFPCDDFITIQLVTDRNCRFATNTELFFVRKTTCSSWKVTFKFDHVVCKSPPRKWAWWVGGKPGALDQNLFVSNHLGTGCNVTGVDWPGTTPVRGKHCVCVCAV